MMVSVKVRSTIPCDDCGGRAVKCNYVPGGGKHLCLDCGRDQTYVDGQFALMMPMAEMMRDFTDEELARHEAFVRSKSRIVKQVYQPNSCGDK